MSNSSSLKLLHAPLLPGIDIGVLRAPAIHYINGNVVYETGPGLGNLLFPISRAVIGQHLHGGDFAYPTMRQLKLGTLLRSERDSRTYGSVFRKRALRDWKFWAYSKFAPSITENITFTEANPHKFVTIEYHGMKDYFHDLTGFEDIIGEWIQEYAILEGVIAENYDIGIHVRLGDFRDSRYKGEGFSVKQPYSWYSEAYNLALKKLGINSARTFLFTDEDGEKVSNALGIDELHIDPSKNAITAISNLSKAKIILTSRSTFSMWAAYLGQTKAIWNSDFDISKSFPTRRAKDYFL